MKIPRLEKTNNPIKSIENTSDCFQYLSKEDLVILQDKKRQIQYLKGETLFKQGAFAPYVLYVIEGVVKVYLQTGHSKQISIRLAKKGDFLAFSSIFGEDVYTYSAAAIKNSTICMIEKEALKQLLITNPEFAMEITSRNCKNESQYIDLIHTISYKQMRGKLASALLYLSSKDLLEEQIFQYLTRQDIADFANITVESTIKFLKEFEKENILKLDGKNIVLIDLKKLEQIGTHG
jgi:CRP-like cAMP-binding protein